MIKKRRITIVLLILLFIVWVQEPVGRNAAAIDVDDGTVADWTVAQVALFDPVGDSPNDMTDLTFVAFDFDDTWFYVRWDIDNDTYSPAVLYDMGINTTATGTFWDMYVSAQIELIGGVPEITNISIRDANDVHLWNASDDGNMTDDGSLYLDPAPGALPGNHSTEARFPLAAIGIPYGVIYGQFRSHASTSVNSNVKDKVPDSGYIVLSIDKKLPELSNLADTPDPQSVGGNVNITVDVTDDYGVNTVWVNITLPNGSSLNVSMLPGGGNQWYSNITYDVPGTYSYRVWANDSSDNWNSTGPGSITIYDNEGPEFDNLSDAPDPQISGGPVNITVEVMDNIDVDEVWINISYPSGSWLNTTMKHGIGDGWFLNITYVDVGGYSYTVWANDTSDNWNSTGPDAFVVIDTLHPQIITVMDWPDPQENGGYVNITAEITDDMGVAGVWVNITYPNGSWNNASMIRGIGDEWFYNSTYDELNQYSYLVWAKDTGNKWNTTGSENFTIIDTDPPELFGLDDVPDPQYGGGFVNITVNVVDDVSVDSVWVNITYPDSSWINTSMGSGSGNAWIFEIVYNALGTYSYTVWANDTSNNWNATSFGTFAIQDIGLPELDNVTATPDPQENGGEINITVDVIDSDGVGEVWVNITFPDGSSINVSMDTGGGSEWFYNATYDDIDVHSFTVWANDTTGNWNSTSPDTFTIIDTDAPEFLDASDSPDPQENGGNVNITAQVMDDVGVVEVWVAIIYPDSSIANNSMVFGSGDEWFFDVSYDILGMYSYTVWAKDVADNWNLTGPETFMIIDTDPPEFTNLVDAPDPQENDDVVTVTIDITDDVGVAEVWINITHPDSTWVNTSVDNDAGDTWTFDSSFSDLGNYSYRIWARDTSGNWNSSAVGLFVIHDTDGPDFVDVSEPPDDQEGGGDVNISVEATDDVGTDGVWLNITLPDGTSLNVSMSPGGGDSWFYNASFDDAGNYSYTIWATDVSGNWNNTTPAGFSITIPEPPEPPEEPEDEPDLLHMIMLLIFWPLFMILLTALVVKKHGFDNRFKRHLDKKAPKFARNFEALHTYSSDLNRQIMQEIVFVCLKAGIPVEEFILALQGAWSSGQVDVAQPGFLNDEIREIFNSIETGFDKIIRK